MPSVAEDLVVHHSDEVLDGSSLSCLSMGIGQYQPQRTVVVKISRMTSAAISSAFQGVFPAVFSVFVLEVF